MNFDRFREIVSRSTVGFLYAYISIVVETWHRIPFAIAAMLHFSLAIYLIGVSVIDVYRDHKKVKLSVSYRIQKEENNDETRR